MHTQVACQPVESRVQPRSLGPTRITLWGLFGQLSPLEPPRETHVATSPFHVGRGPGNDLTLRCLTVSKRHAEFYMVRDTLWLRDLGSYNGTFVNGQRVEADVPLQAGDILQIGKVLLSVRSHTIQDAPRTMSTDSCRRARECVGFEQLMAGQGLKSVFQPIVHMGADEVIGYEALARSTLAGLMSPSEMFRVAVELGQEVELSQRLRTVGVAEARELGKRLRLFLNTHPAEVGHPSFLDSLVSLRETFPEARIVLEIHEATVVQGQDMEDISSLLEELDMELAFDDFGMGQSRMLELIDRSPDYLKFDRNLTRDIHAAPSRRQQMVAALATLASQLGIATVAEGLETPEETETCRQLGFDFAQGYHLGRPVPVNELTTS